MVRIKEKPSHLDKAQQKENSFNLQNLSQNYSDNLPSSSTAETTLINFINDDEEEEENSEILSLHNNKNNLLNVCKTQKKVLFADLEEEVEGEDDDDDDDYQPPLSHRKKIKKKSLVQEDKQNVKKKQKENAIDYGLFKDVLEKCDFCVKIDTKENSTNIHCLFGELSIEIINFSLNDLIIKESFWLYVSKDKNESAIYFEWCDEQDICSPSKRKSKKLKANNFKFFNLKGQLDFELWKGLGIQRYFQIVYDKFENNFLFLKIYFLKSGIVNLQSSYEFNQGNKCISAVCSYFYGIKSFQVSEEINHNHDIDSFYKAIKNAHKDTEYNTSINVQHSSLIPQLRPYQKEAVKWMLYKERINSSSVAKKELHPLYIEITCLDQTLLYYNYYGWFFVSNKPLEIVSCPGGILADEMGLGKTVEVLACILCHFREMPDECSSLETFSTSNKTLQKNFKINSEFSPPDYFNDLKKEEKLNENRLEKEMKPKFSDIKNVESEMNETKISKISGRRAKREASSRISYSFFDALLDSDKGSDNEPEFYPNSSDDDSLESKQSHNESSRCNKRKASLLRNSYKEDYEEDDIICEVKAKKKKLINSPSKNTFNADQEISKNSILSTIEKVILEKCWEGILKNYKSQGSYKDIRTFLKKRKKDPYYMMSLKEKMNVQYLSSIAEYSATSAVKRSVIKGFFDTKVKQKSYFECVCGKEEKEDRDDMSRVQCSICSLWQHADCVQFKLCNMNRKNYICPHCWTLQPPIVTGATLIVTPASISHQVCLILFFFLVVID